MCGLLPEITLASSWVSARGCSQITGRRQITKAIPKGVLKLKLSKRIIISAVSTGTIAGC